MRRGVLVRALNIQIWILFHMNDLNLRFNVKRGNLINWIMSNNRFLDFKYRFTIMGGFS